MDDIDDLIDKLDAYKLDNVSHFDTMSEGLAELLGDNENEPNPKPLRIAKARKDTLNIPSELSPILIGPGGVKVKQLEKTTGARIRIHSNNKADSTVTIQGTTDSVNLAKAQIEVMRQKLIKKSVKLNANKQNFGGKLPNSWLTNPLPGKLIDDCLLPIKCPLHENFEAEVLENDGKMFSLEDVWALEKKYKRKIGLIVDSTKTNRYYDRSEVVDRGTKFKKVPLEVPDNLTVMPFDMIHKIVDYIDNYRTTEPDKLVAIHCSKTNRCGLIIVCYLCRVRGIPLNDALEEFKNATDGVGIYRQVFIDKLYEKYSNNNEPKPICPSRPEWVTD